MPAHLVHRSRGRSLLEPQPVCGRRIRVGQALEMKTALVASSIKRPQWSDLRAGLVSVEGASAMEATEHPPEPVTSPYQTWSEWRKRSVEYRMDQLSAGDSDQVRDIILSFVDDPFPDAALQPISECLNHPKSEVRAAALCALASKTSEVNPDYIKEGFRDVAPIVRSAAVYLLQNCPALWSECSASLSVLFNDPSLDVRYVSFNLARRMAHPRFAEEIVSGLEEDARMGRISNFAARRDALEAITGHRLPERPPYYVHGQFGITRTSAAMREWIWRVDGRIGSARTGQAGREEINW